MELEQRPLGNTDICISKLGYGCASVWGKQMISDEQAKKNYLKKHTGWESGILTPDTAMAWRNSGLEKY